MSNIVNVVNYALALLGTGIKDEEGQGMIEYVLIAALISIFAIGAIVLVGPEIQGQFTAVTNAIPAAPAAP